MSRAKVKPKTHAEACRASREKKIRRGLKEITGWIPQALYDRFQAARAAGDYTPGELLGILITTNLPPTKDNDK